MATTHSEPHREPNQAVVDQAVTELQSALAESVQLGIITAEQADGIRYKEAGVVLFDPAKTLSDFVELYFTLPVTSGLILDDLGRPRLQSYCLSYTNSLLKSGRISLDAAQAIGTAIDKPHHLLATVRVVKADVAEMDRLIEIAREARLDKAPLVSEFSAMTVDQQFINKDAFRAYLTDHGLELPRSGSVPFDDPLSPIAPSLPRAE